MASDARTAVVNSAEYRRSRTVADEVPAEHGPKALSLRELARRAGVSHARRCATFRAWRTCCRTSRLGAYVALAEARTSLWQRSGRSVALRPSGCRVACLHRFRHRPSGSVQVDVPLRLVDPGENRRAVTSHEAFGSLVDLVEAARAERWQPDVDPVMLSGALPVPPNTTIDTLLR